jgi:hypothetical protein
MAVCPGIWRVGLGFFAGQHLNGHVIEEHDEKTLQKPGGQLGGDIAPHKGSREDADNDFAHHIPVYRPTFVVGAKAGHGGEHDTGQRGA